ncbi:hypothetical protein G7078_08985 [Sphingomonas sinipercae]|uniref:DUF481 domain-containing protein n=1 Tax=Sphingomonas sinipercae TaxID=2714944 RepID=A0A6G7ZPP8_9SPHN|nr:hypothetical protein [Sphingomonas sinipercae]QIL02905.1 hypothetical protein G7078_08985 [Sphingomonas sinipercae]
MIARSILALAAATTATPSLAQQSDVAINHAVGADVFFSSDAEDTEVIKAGFNLDWRYRGPEDYQGVRVERVRFTPLGQESRTFDRAYLRLADDSGRWKWAATVGTDGHTLLGSATVHDEAKFRKEFFVEREMIETPLGVSKGIYYTFAGAAIDLPANDRNIFTAFVGAQEFTGDNVRLHLRGNYIHVIDPGSGLSAQLRTRYFRSSEPGEYDYYSPRWYAQVLPVLQMRRFVSGWQLLGAAGYGAQRDSGSDWHSSRYLNARATSPRFNREWAFSADLLYSNTPVSTGFTYSYVQFRAGLTKAF